MTKTKRLKSLRRIIKDCEKKAKELNEIVFNDSVLNWDAYLEIQRLNTKIHYTKKKIGFLKKGKSYLGDSLGSTNIRTLIH